MLRRPATLFIAVAAAVLVLDQGTKHVVRAAMSPPGTSIPIVGDIVKLTYVRNTGAAFGMLPGHPVMFAAVSVIVLAGIAIYWWRVRPARRILIVALGLLSGGSTGNLIDRVTVGRVTDFIAVPDFPVFNVADSAILVGVIILMWWLLFGPASHEAATGGGDGRTGAEPDPAPEGTGTVGD